ncbi:hypothetical protein G7Y89_g8319 [Cudoniella acicularis]|uniref:DUF7924 domain-containing protein n=1 Tax=Cudoniella acicularis TaxID=354080 RepID=A0A8H4RJC3_9HELO|nr:hypothetical protein G7Y89_g8319 [Cudoniella acicularis]
MNGTEARLYVSWKHDELKYYTRKVDSFLLQKPKDYVEFRKYVRNIIDWGKDKRLNEIRDSLNSPLEESRKTASQLAKSRPPPSSDDSARSSSQKHKSSSSRGRNSKSKTVQEYPSGGGNTPPSACFHEHNQDDSYMQIPAADDVYAPPSPASRSTIKMSPLCKLLLRIVSKKTISTTPLCKSPLRTMYTLRLPPVSRSTIRDGPFMQIYTDPVEGPREIDHNSKSKDSQQTLGLNLFTCRSWFEKFAPHQLATAHSCLAIPDTLHLSSCIFPLPPNTVADRQSRCSSICVLSVCNFFWSPSTSMSGCLIAFGKHSSPVGTIVGLCALEVVEHLEATA